MGTKKIADIFQRSLVAHLPPTAFSLLQDASVFIGGLGGGSNIAELLARKGVGHLTIADLDVFEPHNVRQRGSLSSTWGRSKVDVHDRAAAGHQSEHDGRPVRKGVTLENVSGLVRRSDVRRGHAGLPRVEGEGRALPGGPRAREIVVTTPSVVNGAVLYVFTPEGPSVEAVLRIRALDSARRLALRFPSPADHALSGRKRRKRFTRPRRAASGPFRWTPSASTRRRSWRRSPSRTSSWAGAIGS